ncbi:MAG: glyceraldehyde 3-phosphate dehydrogenase NAD-binding domain-containing protein [Candidatus Woesearchaeota archaeon]
MRKIRIGINGFGRIGRAFTRINIKYNLYDIVVINELDPDINNLAYLLKYDSIYGRLSNVKIDIDKNFLIIDNHKIRVFHEDSIDNVDWHNYSVDLVIDASGVKRNVLNSSKIIKDGLRKVIITHSPDNGVDFTYMKGVNEKFYDPLNHNIISCSICDANAVGPFFKLIDDVFGIESGDITTLHPWLSYQNLLDGNLKSVSNPSHYWTDYALGRSSIGNLIPKGTTLVKALSKILPGIETVLNASSFRVPTSIVASAVGIFLLKKSTTINEIYQVLNEYIMNYKDVLQLDDRSLVSIDYLCSEYAAIVDKRWLYLNKSNLLKFVLWYDNEWGYAYRVYNSINDLLK